MLGQHRQQRLEVVAGQRLDVHLRAGQHVADRDRLQALGRRVGGHDDVHALANERQPHLDQHLFRLAGLDGERRGLAVGKAVAHGPDDVAAGRHVGERHLADRIAGGLRDHDVAVDAAQRHVHRRNAHAFQRKGHRHTSGTGSWRLCGWRLRCSRSSGARDVSSRAAGGRGAGRRDADDEECDQRCHGQDECRKRNSMTPDGPNLSGLSPAVEGRRQGCGSSRRVVDALGQVLVEHGRRGIPARRFTQEVVEMLRTAP